MLLSCINQKAQYTFFRNFAYRALKAQKNFLKKKMYWNFIY